MADPRFSREERRMLKALEVCLNGACVWKDQAARAGVVKVLEEVKGRVYFTETEERIMSILSDGKPHTLADLYECLDDDLALPVAPRTHIKNLKYKLPKIGKSIVTDAGHWRKKTVTTYTLTNIK